MVSDLYDLPLHVLTDRQRVVFTMHYQEGWTLTRVAAALHVRRQSVTDVHQAGLRRIRERLLSDGFDPCLRRNTIRVETPDE